jgi:glutamate-ammonia-ligase adenylyltransferase
MTKPKPATRLVAPPLVVDARRARKRLTDILREGGPEFRAAFAALAAERDGLEAFVTAALDGSPFLVDLAERDLDRFLRVLASEPDDAFAAVLARLAVEAAAASDDAELMRVLRRAKQEAALVIALADLSGAWEVMRVTGALTAFAETATGAALDVLLRREASRGRVRLDDEAAPSRGCGYFILGMGKLGARELNFSSDIDLIAFYDADAVRLTDHDEHQAVFVRLTQQLARLLGERSYDGVVFRVDLRLRPDPGTYPVAISTRLALNYYEAIGQTWERAAFIKARPIAGDLAAGEAFLAEMRPFVWRKYLDYAALAEVHAMKRQIHAVKGHERIAVEGHDLKLGRGGIREIEFFAQTQQLIGGGRNPRLRAKTTLEALRELEAAGWIGVAARDELSRTYLELRALEHRVQMVADEQTHALPADAETLASFARFAGFKSPQSFAKAVSGALATVQAHYARLFEEAPGAASQTAARLGFAGTSDVPETRATLKEMGFVEPRMVVETVRGWLAGRLPATRAAAARERLAEIVPRLLEALAGTGEPDAALAAFDRFVERLPAGVQVFSLLRSNPNLLDLFAMILGTAPRLATMLSRRPRVLDGLIEALHLPGRDSSADIDARFAAALAEASGFEDALDRLRILTQEQTFLIGVRLLSGTLPMAQAGGALSRLADAALTALHPRVTAEIARRHGRTPADRSAIVAFGKLGSLEMTATSDLDLMLLYDDPFDAQSDGERPLYAAEYYTRLTQRLVAALTAPTAEGTLYAVDLRLRPSGNKGPLATSLSAFTTYQESEAWTWEHMALTRARIVSAPPELAERIEEVVTRIVRRERDEAKLTADIVEMRRMVWTEKPPSGPWDVKLIDGGQVDLEFIAQWLTLRHAAAHPSLHARATAAVFEAARRTGVLPAEDARALLDAARLYNALTQVLRLALDGPFDPDNVPKGLAAMIARAAELPDLRAVEIEFGETRARVRRIAKRLWRTSPWTHK